MFILIFSPKKKIFSPSGKTMCRIRKFCMRKVTWTSQWLSLGTSSITEIGRARTSGDVGERKSSMLFCFFVRYALNGEVYEREIAIKPFELRLDVDTLDRTGRDSL